MDDHRVCRRCLLSQMADQRPLLALIEERVALLPEEARAPQALYGRRLSLCRLCDHLRGGTCARCGCYVELRAAKRKMRCPDVPARW